MNERTNETYMIPRFSSYGSMDRIHFHSILAILGLKRESRIQLMPKEGMRVSGTLLMMSHGCLWLCGLGRRGTPWMVLKSPETQIHQYPSNNDVWIGWLS